MEAPTDYTALVHANGRISLFAERSENGVKFSEHIVDFCDWLEFVNIAASTLTFTSNPFDLVGRFYVQTASGR